MTTKGKTICKWITERSMKIVWMELSLADEIYCSKISGNKIWKSVKRPERDYKLGSNCLQVPDKEKELVVMNSRLTSWPHKQESKKYVWLVSECDSSTYIYCWGNDKESNHYQTNIGMCSSCLEPSLKEACWKDWKGTERSHKMNTKVERPAVKRDLWSCNSHSWWQGKSYMILHKCLATKEEIDINKNTDICKRP